MKKPILIHNPRCSKSREAKEILENSGIEFVTIDYLKEGLKEKLLIHLPKLLGLSYPEMIRSKEDIYKELKLKEQNLTDSEWVKILIQYPVLLERPIFIINNKAFYILCRTPTNTIKHFRNFICIYSFIIQCFKEVMRLKIFFYKGLFN